MTPALYRFVADVILILHFLFIAFVILGQLLVVIGGFAKWRWVRNPWFRMTHLAAIGIVVVQAWLGMTCPLTTWERWLRDRAGDAVYDGTFIAHWLRKCVFFEAPLRVFTACYTTFALLVIASWIFLRPRPFRRKG